MRSAVIRRKQLEEAKLIRMGRWPRVITSINVAPTADSTAWIELLKQRYGIS